MSFCGLRIYLSRITSNRWDQSATKLRMYKSLLIIRLFIESNEWQWYPVLQLQQKKKFEASVHIWHFPGFPMKGNGWAFMVKNWGYGWSEYAIRWSTFIIKWPYPSLPYEESLIVGSRSTSLTLYTSPLWSKPLENYLENINCALKSSTLLNKHKRKGNLLVSLEIAAIAILRKVKQLILNAMVKVNTYRADSLIKANGVTHPKGTLQNEKRQCN